MATEVSSYARGTQPYSCIGYIGVTFPDGTTIHGTCTLVGRNDILTATHVVYSPDNGGWAIDVDFYFGADYNAITGRFEDKGYEYSPTKWEIVGWPDQTFADYNNETMLPSETKFDIAMIGVAEPIGDVLGWLGLDSGYNGSHSANAVGYPIGTTGMMQETVTVQKDFHNEIYESNYTTMGPGSSGGPLLIDNYVIGVMSAGVGNTAMWADVGTVYSSLTDFMDSNDSLLGTIVDTTAPTVSSFSPTDGATAVSTTTNIVVTFNEAIQRGAGSIILKTAAGNIVETFDVATSSRISISGSSFIIDPTATLANSTQYYLSLSQGSLKDLAGNAYAGISSYDFTTLAATGGTSTPYVTLDYLPDLTGSEMSTSGRLTWSTYTPIYSTSTWDYQASVSGSNDYALLHDIYSFSAKAGATYDIFSRSYFDPYLLRIYDHLGNTIVANDESDDPVSTSLTSSDVIWNWKAPYTGTYYVAASWNQGSYYKDYSLTIYEDIGTVTSADTTAPLAATFSPSDGATGVSTTANIVVTFNEAIQRGTGTIGLWNSLSASYVETFDVATSSRLTFSGSTLTIDPLNPLANNTGYFVTFDAGNIKDLAGNAYGGTYDYDFTTIALVDATSPTLFISNPANNATNVATSANLVLTFNEAIKAGTGNILIKNFDGSVAKTIAVTDSSQVSISGSTVTLNPSSNFSTGSSYYVSIAAGVIKDLAGNSFAGISDPTTYNFATAVPVDTTAPLLSSLSPTDNATSVATSANLVLTFNEAIQAGTGNILIKNVDGSVAKIIAVTDSSQVSISGSTVTLNPSADLASDSSYYVNIASGTLKDLAGNSFAGITDTTTYNFTTALALIEGTHLNDRLIATSQNESINGADGIDTVVYAGLRSGYTITQANQNITITDIANSKSIDTLISVERLAFSDINIALDLNGHAGTTAKILGAVFGADAISNTSYAGIGLKLLDEGMSYEPLMALAINVTGAIPPQAVVDLLWNNVVGGLPNNEQAQPFVDMLNMGLSIGQLGILAADTDLNKINIDLVGLAQTGLAYTEAP